MTHEEHRVTASARRRPEWGNLELDLGPIPPNTPGQRRAAQLTVIRLADGDRDAAVEVLAALGLNERIPA